MLELLELERIVADEDSYTLQLKIPKSLFPFYKDFFRAIEAFADEMSHKARLAEQMTDNKRADREREKRMGWDVIKANMRILYRTRLVETRSHVEATKALTAVYKPYTWLRDELKREIQAQWDLTIPKMLEEGKTSFQIAEVLGISPGAIRKIMSNSKTQLKSSIESV